VRTFSTVIKSGPLGRFAGLRRRLPLRSRRTQARLRPEAVGRRTRVTAESGHGSTRTLTPSTTSTAREPRPELPPIAQTKFARRRPGPPARGPRIQSHPAARGSAPWNQTLREAPASGARTMCCPSRTEGDQTAAAWSRSFGRCGAPPGPGGGGPVGTSQRDGKIHTATLGTSWAPPTTLLRRVGPIGRLLPAWTTCNASTVMVGPSLVVKLVKHRLKRCCRNDAGNVQLPAVAVCPTSGSLPSARGLKARNLSRVPPGGEPARLGRLV
jgi:hypothetical protein